MADGTPLLARLDRKTRRKVLCGLRFLDGHTCRAQFGHVHTIGGRPVFFAAHGLYPGVDGTWGFTRHAADRIAQGKRPLNRRGQVTTEGRRWMQESMQKRRPEEYRLWGRYDPNAPERGSQPISMPQLPIRAECPTCHGVNVLGDSLLEHLRLWHNPFNGITPSAES